MDDAQEGTQGFLTRRGFVGAVASAAASTVLGGCARLLSVLPPGVGHLPSLQRVTPFVTPNEDFYMVAVDPTFRPAVSPATVGSSWSLEMVGLGGGVRPVGYDELNARARRSIPYTFECIGNPVGGSLIGNAFWRVLPLREVLAQAPGGLGGARSVMIEAMDGFYSSVSLARALDDYAFVAVEMNGVPLPAEHGFPARVILPDLYGKKQPRWLRRISLLEEEKTTSYWEKRLWKGNTPPKTKARLDPRENLVAGRPVELTGIAFAGARGVSAVEVSLDGGRSWLACELVTGMRPHVWSLWRYTWPNPPAGRHMLRYARQTARASSRRPDGRAAFPAAPAATTEWSFV